MSQVFTLLILFFKSLPEIISLIREIAKYINQAADAWERQAKTKELKEAVKQARETKDTSKLEDVFGIVPTVLPTQIKTQTKIQEIKTLVSPSSAVTLKFIDPLPKDLEKELIDSEFTALVPHSLGNSNVGGAVPATAVIYNNMGGGGRMGHVFIPVLIAFIMMGCEDNTPNRPNYKPKLWAGDSDRGGITRAQSSEFLSANDPRFNDFVSMRYNTLTCIYEAYVQNCAAFKQAVPKCTTLSQDDKQELKRYLNF